MVCLSLACMWGILRQDASAQRYNFKFYGEDEGLQNLSVQTVLQDRSGFYGRAHKTDYIATMAAGSRPSRERRTAGNQNRIAVRGRRMARCG